MKKGLTNGGKKGNGDPYSPLKHMVSEGQSRGGPSRVKTEEAIKKEKNRPRVLCHQKGGIQRRTTSDWNVTRTPYWGTQTGTAKLERGNLLRRKGEKKAVAKKGTLSKPTGAPGDRARGKQGLGEETKSEGGKDKEETVSGT